MFKDNLYTGDDARNRLISGVKKVAEAVGGTMGTGGANSIIETIESPQHMVTNDGWTIASNIRFSDPIEEMGRNILIEAISRANKASGDGSSTTTVLTAAILEEGMKHIGAASPMDIKRSLEACIPIIEKNIQEQKREIDVKEVGRVAAISAEDEAVGKLIQDIYEQIGKSGIIHWDISKTPEDVYTIGKGITVIDCGYASPYMCDVEDSGRVLSYAKAKDVPVIITRSKVTHITDFNPVFDALFKEKKMEVVIFCDDYDPLVLADIYMTRAKTKFNIILVKMPILWRDWWYEDLAKASGATIIDPMQGLSNKSIEQQHLGKFEHVTVHKDKVEIDGMKDLTDHIKGLELEATDDSKLRASRLNTKTARLYIGAISDSALSYKRLKVEDAIAAAYHALNGGIVTGGGSALLNASAVLKHEDGVGAKILVHALEAPARQIYKNAGARVPDFFDYSGKDIGGFDSRTKKENGDMFKAGIADPATIVLNAVKNAVSVAAAILTANTIVLYPQLKDPQPQVTPPTHG